MRPKVWAQRCGVRGRDSVAEAGGEMVRVAHQGAGTARGPRSGCLGGSSPTRMLTAHARREGEERPAALPASACTLTSKRETLCLDNILPLLASSIRG